MSTPVIAVMNQKGGVGKTTTSLALAEVWGKRDALRVLLIDSDPQASLSTAAGLGGPYEAGGTWETVYEDPANRKDILGALVDRADLGFTILPSDIYLDKASSVLASAPKREYRLSLAIKRLLAVRPFDVVIVDCPPSTGVLTLNAVIAASHVVIPLIPEFLAMDGTAAALALLQEIADWYPDAAPGFIGVVPIQVDRESSQHAEMLERARGELGERIFDLAIPKSLRAKWLPSQGAKTVMDIAYAPWAKAYMLLADRLGALAGILPRENVDEPYAGEE